jgi:hypothetical protein
LVRDGVGCVGDRSPDVLSRQMRVGIDQIGFCGSLG